MSPLKLMISWLKVKMFIIGKGQTQTYNMRKTMKSMRGNYVFLSTWALQFLVTDNHNIVLPCFLASATFRHIQTVLDILHKIAHLLHKYDFMLLYIFYEEI